MSDLISVSILLRPSDSIAHLLSSSVLSLALDARDVEIASSAAFLTQLRNSALTSTGRPSEAPHERTLHATLLATSLALIGTLCRFQHSRSTPEKNAELATELFSTASSRNCWGSRGTPSRKTSKSLPSFKVSSTRFILRSFANTTRLNPL